MLILFAVLLGIIQGLTEFLPVSSSGHLVAVQNLIFKELSFFNDYGLEFDVALHFATLVVIVIFFRKPLSKILNSFRFTFQKEKTPETSAALQKVKLIIIGSIPTAIIGIIIKMFIEEILHQTIYVGILLLVTGLIMMIPYWMKNRRTGKELTVLDSLIIGIVQGFAVLPGISRSGSTISSGLIRGISKDAAFEFSFLLSIPAILGACIITLVDLDFSQLTLSTLWIFLAGMVAGGVAGYLGIIILSKVVKRNRLNLFSYYCFGLGFVLIILSLLKV